MKTVFEYTKGMEADVSTSYCPGCTHGIAHRLIMEVLEEKGQLQNTIGVAPVGCSIAAPRFMKIDMTEAFHGRAPAVASGIRRVHPDKYIFTYQGDGDLTSIGGNEILHAAERGEKFCTFFINNAIYGMTGGQMAYLWEPQRDRACCPFRSSGNCNEDHIWLICSCVSGKIASPFAFSLFSVAIMSPP